jgi:hypothetical protein
MAQKTLLEREALISKVEDLMVRGIRRPGSIIRMVDGLASTRTAKHYVELVEQRWRSINGATNEKERARLIAEAKEIHKRAFDAVAQASNFEPTAATQSAIATALGVALKALERQSKLLGLDSEKRVVDAGDKTLEAIRDAKLLEFDRADPLRDFYTLPVAADHADETDFGTITEGADDDCGTASNR